MVGHTNTEGNLEEKEFAEELEKMLSQRKGRKTSIGASQTNGKIVRNMTNKSVDDGGRHGPPVSVSP